MLQNLKKLLIVQFFFLLPAIANAQSMSSVFFDAGYWKKFDWNNAEQSLLWRDTGFKEIELNEAVTKVIAYEREKSVQIDKQTFKTSLTKYHRDSYPYLARISIQNLQKTSCEDMQKKLSGVFGRSSEMVDYSHFVIQEFNQFEYHWQWDVGNTRVSLQCGNNGKEPDINGAVSIRYSHLDDSSKIEKPIHMTCLYKDQGTYQNYGNKTIETTDWSDSEQPLDITVLPSRQFVINAGRRAISYNAVTTYSSINFSVPNDKIEMAFTINRMNGAMNAFGVNKTVPEETMRFEGTCKAREPNKRKF